VNDFISRLALDEAWPSEIERMMLLWFTNINQTVHGIDQHLLEKYRFLLKFGFEYETPHEPLLSNQRK
jgi:hypothetical protein